jgi:putative ABC transport system permease protein
VFLRILRDSLFRQKRRKAVVLVAVALGTATAAALGDIALDIGDKMNGELKAFGANLVVVPKGGGAPVIIAGEDVSALRFPAFLGEADVLKIKDNFWKNNILALAPSVDIAVKSAGRIILLRGTWFDRQIVFDPQSPDEKFLAGIRGLNPYWSVEGRWPDDRTAQTRAAGGGVAAVAATDAGNATGGAGDRADAEVLVGRTLAGTLGVRTGDRFDVEGPAGPRSLTVAGILATGGEEDGAIVSTLETAWALSGAPGRIARIEVRALTTPESAVYERLGKNPRELSPAEFEKWSCTPFVSSIAYEIQRAIPTAEARVIRRIADSEGQILRRTSGLMLLIALMATFGAALTVTSALTTSVLERKSEIGLFKAMGAGGPRTVGLFLAEAAILGTLGGLGGAGAGALMARWISATVFGSPVGIRPLSIPLAVVAALAITSIGCILPARRIMQFRPFEVLRGL